MTAKEYLNQIRTLDVIIKQKRQEVDELHQIATSIGSFDYSKDRVQTSPKGEAPYARTAEKAAELDAEITHWAEQRDYIINQIYSLGDSRYVSVLTMRYAEYGKYKKFDDIAKALDYHWHYVYQLHNEALDAFSQKFVNNLKNIVV